MMNTDFEWLVIGLMGGVLIDVIFGDPSNKYHPVSWSGNTIGFFIKRSKNSELGLKYEKFLGAVFAIVFVMLTWLSTQTLVYILLHLFGIVAATIAGAMILKVTIAIKGMEKHVLKIVNALQIDDIVAARRNLSLIVGRDTLGLDRQYILSATIECIGESTVDGIIGPLFFFSLLGPAGSFAYRIVNTLDSMLGYTTHYYKNIGWMSAWLDTVVNYVPARITSYLIVVSSLITRADWKQSIKILCKDHKNTVSYNAGYPMAAMAGALRIKLEKIDYYSLGENREPLSIEKCWMALFIMKVTTILFLVVLSVPVILILYFVGWWKLLFGI